MLTASNWYKRTLRTETSTADDASTATVISSPSARFLVDGAVTPTADYEGRHCSAQPTDAKVRSLSAPARTGRHATRNRTGRTNPLHCRLVARRRYVERGQHRPEQGRGTPRPQERAADRASGRNPRPLQRGPALPHRWDQPARRHRDLLGYRPSLRSGRTAETRRPDR